jgi:hypothetical protein
LESERPPGQFFSTKSGILSFNKIPLTNNEMDVVITAQVFENVFYTEKFSAERISSPTCYAFGVGTDEGMAPHKLAHKAQHPTCHGCHNNAWGSDPGGGRGKACKNLRRLCLIPAGNAVDAEAINKATAGFLRVPVTSTKPWAEYVRELSLKGRTPLTVVTKIKLVPDPKTMHALQFSFVRPVDDRSVQEALVNRHSFDLLDIVTPYAPKDEGNTAGQQQNQQAAAAMPASSVKFG